MIDYIFRKKYLVVIILLILAIIFLYIGLSRLNNSSAKPGTLESSTETEDWVKYTNPDYNFAVSFPADWKIYEELSNKSLPRINIYKPSYKIALPLDNFSPESNVSIFPKGLATDIVMGETKPATFKMADKTDKSFDYLLTGGEAWASYLTFISPPKSWESWGFIWLNSEVKDLKYKCKSGEKEVPLGECNTFEGDILERAGKIDKETRATELKILESFKFI